MKIVYLHIIFVLLSYHTYQTIVTNVTLFLQHEKSVAAHSIT